MMRCIYSCIIFLLVSCDNAQHVSHSNSSTSFCFYNKSDFDEITAELKHRKLRYSASVVPSEIGEEKYCIYPENFTRNEIGEIENFIFGFKPPAGLSISRSGGNEQSVKLLESNGIKVSRGVYRGKEYISWGYENHEKAEELLGLSDEQRKFMKESRLYNGARLNKSLNPGAQ